MKLGIIYGDISTTHQLMIERADDIFDSVLAAPVDGIKMIHGEESKLIYKDTDLTEFDVVYLRLSDPDQVFAEHITEILNQKGVGTIAEDESFGYESNKFYTMKILAESQVNVPDSVYTLSPETAVNAAEKLGYPVIMKTIRGGGGQGVMRASSRSELKPVMDTMKSLEQTICLQEYMEHGGADIRAIVIGEKVHAYRRVSSNEEEWRSNISEGGERREADLSEETEKTAVKAAKALGFEMCGVDIIETEEASYVIEVNGAFGFSEELNELLGEDVILEMVELLHEKALESQSRENI